MSDWAARRAKEVRRLAYAVGSPLLLFRATTRDRDRTEVFNYAPGAVREIVVSRLVRLSLEGMEILMGPSRPDGLVVLPGVDQAGLEALRADNLPPCAVVQVAPGLFDAWIRLCPAAVLDGDVLLTAARLLAARAGLPVGTAHWQAGGHAPAFASYPSRAPSSPMARLVETGKPFAPGGAKLLKKAKRLRRELEAATAAAGAAGVALDLPMAQPSTDEEAVRLYALAAVSERLHDGGAEAVPLAVALKALMAGAAPDRVRQLLRVGGGLGSAATEAVLDQALRSPELARAVGVQLARFESLRSLSVAARATSDYGAMLREAS